MIRRVTSYHVRAAPVVLLAACLALSVLIAQIAEHAYVATIVIAVAMFVGLALPYLLQRCLSVTVASSQNRGIVGVPLELTIQTRNHLPLPVPVCLRFPDASFATPVSFFAPPGQHTWQLEIVPRSRGEAALDQTRICCVFPFGLAEASRAVNNATELLIRPRPIETACPDSEFESDANFVDSASIDHIGDGDPVGVRAYRRGDSIRLIHWKQSARHEQLIVRERERSRRQTTMILLDVDASHYRNSEDFEIAVSITAGMIDSATLQRRRVVLIAGDDRLEVACGSGRENALDLLARVVMRPDAVTRRQFGCVVITSSLALSQTATLVQRLFLIESIGGGATP